MAVNSLSSPNKHLLWQIFRVFQTLSTPPTQRRKKVQDGKSFLGSYLTGKTLSFSAVLRGTLFKAVFEGCLPRRAT